MNTTRILSALALTLLVLPPAFGQEAKVKPGPKAVEAAHTASPTPVPIILIKQVPCYPLTTCVACNKQLPTAPIDHIVNNRLYRLDADACKKLVDADSAGMAKKIDDAVIVIQKPTYVLRTSVVSGKPLEAEAVDYVYGTRLVRLASRDEIPAFEKDPATAMAKIDQAFIDAQLASYTLKTCPVGKEEIGGAETVNYLYGTKLVRFCCRKCIAAFEADPAKYATALNAK